MIALRGSIRHKESRNSCPSPTPSSTTVVINTTDNTASTSTSTSCEEFNPLFLEPGEWIWTGYWSFGSLPPAEVLDVVGQQKKKKPPSGVRPFVYKFQCRKDPNDVVVPSSLLRGDDEKEGGGDESSKDMKESQVKIEPSDDNKSTNEAVIESSKFLERSEKDTLNVKDESNDRRHDIAKGQPESKVPPVNRVKTSNLEEEKKELDESHEDVKTVTNSSNSDHNETSKSIDGHQPNVAGETYGTVKNGEQYTDAGTTYPKICPLGGCWKGYFENVSVSTKK